MKIYDISIEISNDMLVYGDDEKPQLTDVAEIKQGSLYNLTRFTMTGHMGTHADTPLHFIDGGATCDNIPLDHFYGPAKVIQMPPIMGENPRDITKGDLLPLDIQAGDILLLNTGNKVFTTEAAAYLTEKKIKTLGVDVMSVDAYDSSDFPVHHMLLGSGIAILECLALDGIPQGTYELSALPLKFKNGNGSPVRAILADKRKLDLVIFDMDGLMIDTEPISKEGWRQALAHYGFRMDEDFFSRLLGRGIDTARELMNDHYGTGFDFEKVREKRTAHMENHIKQNGLAMKKGLLHILNTLDQLGIKKCVATSTEWDSMERKLGSLGLLERFDGFVTGDQVQEGKPHPEIFLKAAKLIGVEPANCVVLEDSVVGVTAAYSAGMRPIMIPDMAQPDKATLSKFYARCEDLEQAAKVIESIKFYK